MTNQYTITVEGVAKTYLCRDGQRLLHAVEGMGGRCLKVGCREGGCGVCRVKIHSGSYELGVMSKEHITAEDIEQEIVLSCRVYPKSDMHIESAWVKPKKFKGSVEN